MSPHYDRHAGSSERAEKVTNDLEQSAAEGAAEALRQVEVDAAQEEFDPSTVRADDLAGMSIDELRVLARQLDIPDRAQITEQDELIAAIRQRL